MTAPLDTARVSDAESLPLDAIDVSNPHLYQDDVWQPYFARLRREDPVHYCPASPYGPYWAVTKYKDIMQVEVNHQVYSSASELGGIQIEEQPKGMDRPSFIRMDPPKHDEQRKVVSPVVAPANLANMEGMIRERTVRVLDGLPRGETFDWVDRVSIELTTMMLATLFDYPWEDRRELTYWSTSRSPTSILPKRRCIRRRSVSPNCRRWQRVSARCSTSGRGCRPGSICCRCWRMARRRAKCRSASSWGRSPC